MPETHFEELLRQAHEAWQQGRRIDALQLCDRAALEGPQARYDAAVLRGRMLLLASDPAGALSSFDTVADPSVPDFELDAMRGAALYDLGLLAEAENALRSALRGRPDLAQAHYTLGLVAEIMGTGEDVECFRRARILAPDRYPPAPRRATDEFEEIVEEALEHVAPAVSEILQETPVVIVDLPAVDDLRQRGTALSPRALGLCVQLVDPRRAGLPPETRSEWAMVLFKRNLERSFPERAALIEAIARTVTQELAEPTGIDFEGEDSVP